MNILDNHVHTHFSSDGKDNMEDVIKRAIQIGVKHITFTDHLEYNTDRFSLNCKEYCDTIYRYKEKYKNDIEILLGVEVGYQNHVKDEIEEIVNSNPFDFVLCSTHSVDKINVPDKKYFEGYTKKEAYTRYFESMLETTKNFKNFNSYGHLDYIIRYGNFENNKVIYSDYKCILDEILKNIINNGSGIELNTSGYRYGLDTIHPNMDILKRYKELGGEVITIGSDSHRANDVCKDFDKAYEMLKYVGFKYVCIFRDRKPEFICIDEKEFKKVI